VFHKHVPTEEEWRACAAPWVLLDWVRDSADDRQLRLFACACVRAVWPLTGEAEHPAVLVAEQFADGLAGEAELLAARNSDWAPCGAWSRRGASARTTVRAAANATTSPVAWSAALNAASACAQIGLVPELEQEEQCRLLRDIVLHPLHSPPRLGPAWLTATVLVIAGPCYERRDFTDLPILGDALEDAGCSDEGILAHLRDGGPHVRGCWALDAVLGRARQPAEPSRRPAGWLLGPLGRLRRLAE
jgi:hypothetical protein